VDDLLDLVGFTAWLADRLQPATDLTPSTPLRALGLDDLGMLQVTLWLDQLLAGQGHLPLGALHPDQTIRALHLTYLLAAQRPPSPGEHPEAGGGRPLPR
jgi:hypothetical protein